MNLYFAKNVRPIVALVICALSGVGCSSSNDITNENNDLIVDGTVNEPLTEPADDNSNTVESESESTNPIASGPTTSDPVTPDPVTPDPVTPDPVTPDPVTPDPAVQNTTQVVFEITVPAYQSNELQVQLVWGEQEFSASFVVDESWSVSADFPTDTDNPLIVSFNDRNGAITLGSFETVFRTGSNASETLQISADQFDTNLWDDDGDGVSNLRELIAGTDPSVADPSATPSQTLQPVQASLELVQDKTFRISWQPSEGAQFYRVLENPDGLSGFSQIGNDLGSVVQSFDHRAALYKMFNASYVVQSCNTNGCVDSEEQVVSGSLEQAIGYFKASNTEFEDHFGDTVSLSSDGNTLAVGASGRFGFTGAESDAVYVFQRDSANWVLETILRSNTDDGFAAGFGSDISLDANGDTLAVGEPGQKAVYIYERTDGAWLQETLLESGNAFSSFGGTVSLSGDGTTLAVADTADRSAATGVNGDQVDTSANSSGAVRVFERINGDWQEVAYIKASNTDENDGFGLALNISADGDTLAVGTAAEDSAAQGINSDQSDNAASGSGAVYVFARSSGTWQQQAYIKASNNSPSIGFGRAVSLSADGNTLAVGADRERSFATGINGDQNTDFSPTGLATGSGAVYVFERNDGSWLQQAYIKASNTGIGDDFGISVSLNADATVLAVGARGEDSLSLGINGEQTEDFILAGGSLDRGAAYIFARSNSDWQQQAYLKPSNTDRGAGFGESLVLNSDGTTLAVGARFEASAATGVNGDQSDTSERGAGAVYLY